MSLQIDQVIRGYHLKELIGAGSFGEVYRAHQHLIEREVAIKIILPHYANQPEFIRRFEAEAQVVARVEHPFIVPLYDYWRDPSGAYLVMRLLRGGNLRDLIVGDQLDLESIARILDQVGAALTAAHRVGVIHRDLKPANILLDEQGNAYLADFGIAKILDQDEDSGQGTVVGSPAYLSPEAVKGEDLSPQSDIYSLGILLFEMLTSKKPFESTSISTLMIKHVNEAVPTVLELRPDLTVDIDEVVQRATAKIPKNRYPNALTLAAAFRRALFRSSMIAMTTEHGVTRDKTREHTFDAISDRTQSMGSSLDVELPDPENPYKGLRAFQESDAADFFGRDDLIGQIIARLREPHMLHRFLGIVGASGSGKSSVVKAGVIPALRRGGALTGSRRWYIVEMVPGTQPFEELEAALLRVAVDSPTDLLEQLQADEHGLSRAIQRVLPDDPKIELFLVIDQFEELFTMVTDEQKRALFLTALIEAVTDPASRLYLLVTMRADFYDKPLSYNRFGNMFRQRTEVVLPLSMDDLEEAIAAPAERVGLKLEPGLSQEIVTDVIQQPGALPLLQYALTELFERREDRQMTIQAYRDIGGVSGALARRAEELYQGMSHNEQDILRQIFLRLVSPGEGIEDTRRRVSLHELLHIRRDQTIIQNIIDTFGKYRLLTFDRDPTTRQPTIEVAHEALIRQWMRLREWVNNLREDLRQHARLVHATDEWNNAKRDPSYLARGSRLTQLEEWGAATQLVLTEEELEFIQVSVAQRVRHEENERERTAREEGLKRRTRYVSRALALVFAIGFMVAAILAVLALRAQQDAEASAENAHHQEAIALENQRISQSLALVANARNALNEYQPNLALALALEATRAHIPPLPDAQRILATTAYGAGIRYELTGHRGSVIGLAISPDGNYALSASADRTLILWNLRNGEQVFRMGGHTDWVLDVAFSPDGNYAISGGKDNTAILWNLRTGNVVRRFEGHTDDINAVAFTPDGQHILTGTGYFPANSSDTIMRMWNVETGEQERDFVHLGAVHDIAVSPDGRYAATASGSADGTVGATDRRVRLWDLQTGQLIRRYEGFAGLPRSVAFSPDGTKLVVGTWDATNSGTVRVFDVSSGEEIRRFFGHPDIVTKVGFLPDGQHVVSTSWDTTLRIWDVTTGIQTNRFDTHDDRILGMAISPDGETILTGTGNVGGANDRDRPLDTKIRLWDLKRRDEIQQFNGHNDWVWAVAYSPDGRYIATGSGSLFTDQADHTIRIWDTTIGEQIRIIDGHDNTVDFLKFNHDGTKLLSGSWDNTLALWDVATGGEIQRFTGHRDRVFTADISPDERFIISGSADRTILLWNAETGEMIRRFGGIEGAINTVAFSPDGNQIISGDEDGNIVIRYTVSGLEFRRYTAHEGGITRVSFANDGVTFVSSSKDSTAILWDVATGDILHRFEGHSNYVTDAIFTHDGQSIITAGADTTIRVWDVVSGEQIRQYDGHTDWVVSVDISPDNAFIISGSDDRTVRRWRLARSVEELSVWAANNRYIPALSCEQRRQLQLPLEGCEA